LERLAFTSAPNLDRADERVTVVEPLVARLELLARGDVPAGVETGERNRVATLHRRDGRQVAREVSVQRAALKRDLVDHARGTPIQASFGASRTRKPMRLPSSKNSHRETACQSSAA